MHKISFNSEPKQDTDIKLEQGANVNKRKHDDGKRCRKITSRWKNLIKFGFEYSLQPIFQ